MDVKSILAELDFEWISTAKLLELVPSDKLGWQPNVKAMPLGVLANHVAAIPGRYLNFASEGTTTLQTLVEHAVPASKTEILSNFKTNCEKAKVFLNAIDGSWEKRSWNLTNKGNVVLTLPNPLFVRLLVVNHLVHHRGQLSAYLRSLSVPLPSIYGPSADENPFG